MLVFVRFYSGWTAASSVKDLSGHVTDLSGHVVGIVSGRRGLELSRQKKTCSRMESCVIF